MDDDSESRLLTDTFNAHVRLVVQASQHLWNRCSILHCFKNFFRVHLLRNEFLVAIAIVLGVLLFLQFGHSLSRLLGKRFVVLFPHGGIRVPSSSDRVGTVTREPGVLEGRGTISAVYAVQGRRNTMEDRFIIRENIGGSGVHLFAVFDGHGGTFSADYAQKHLLEKLEKEIKAHPEKYSSKNKDKTDTEDCMLNSVNLVKLIKSEIASTDKELIKEALSRRSTSGTTALLVLQNEEFLVVGNVGDSRGVMCCNNSDGSMTSIPLSYDHKPDQLKEKKRIEEAGGWVLFNGVWRVLGILAVSRAMGDTLFKDRNLVISDPDVLCFPLRGSSDPKFYILASDGLWDVFSNEEAIMFAQDLFSQNEDVATVSKKLALEGVRRGSTDNVSVLSVLLPDLGNKKRVVDRRQSVNSPSLGRKQRPARRVVSFEEMERRMMTLEGKSKPEKIEEKVTES